MCRRPEIDQKLFIFVVFNKVRLKIKPKKPEFYLLYLTSYDQICVVII